MIGKPLLSCLLLMDSANKNSVEDKKKEETMRMTRRVPASPFVPRREMKGGYWGYPSTSQMAVSDDDEPRSESASIPTAGCKGLPASGAELVAGGEDAVSNRRSSFCVTSAVPMDSTASSSKRRRKKRMVDTDDTDSEVQTIRIELSKMETSQIEDRLLNSINELDTVRQKIGNQKDGIKCDLNGLIKKSVSELKVALKDFLSRSVLKEMAELKKQNRAYSRGYRLWRARDP